MRVSVDRERCIGAGMCVLTAAEVFDQSEDDGRVLLLEPSPDSGQQNAAREAAQVCPSGAISVSDGDDGDSGGAKTVTEPAAAPDTDSSAEGNA